MQRVPTVSTTLLAKAPSTASRLTTTVLAPLCICAYSTSWMSSKSTNISAQTPRAKGLLRPTGFESAVASTSSLPFAQPRTTAMAQGSIPPVAVPSRYIFKRIRSLFSGSKAAAQEEPEDKLDVPKGTEGIPFRLTPADALEAYARWSWQETPFFTPRTPQRLRPLYLPFWCFEFTLKVTNKQTGVVTYVPYFDIPVDGNTSSQDRRTAAQIYGGYDYNRLLVDTLKAPLVFAQPWDGKKMMKLPSHRAYALFKGHESELDRIEGKKKSSSTSSTSSTFSTSSGADSESFLSTLFSRATPTYTLSTSPTPRPLEVDTFQMAEPMAWALVQKQVIDTELGLMTAGSNIATTTTTAAAASTSTAGAEHSDVIARYSTTSFKVSSSKVTPSSSTTASSSSAAAAATAGGARGSGAASAATSSSSSSSAASGGDAALFDFQFQHVTSRRVYMPGYVTEYSHMGKYWRVFISGVTGEVFGLQQLGMLSFNKFKKRMPFDEAIQGSEVVSVIGFFLRKVLLMPVAAWASTAAGFAYLLSRKFRAFRQETEIERKWAQIKASEAGYQAHLESLKHLWVYRRKTELEMRTATAAMDAWQRFLSQDAVERTRVEDIERARAMAEAEERAREQERMEEEKRKREAAARERERLKRLAMPPPPIPKDVYVLLGMKKPTSYDAARELSQHDVTRGFRAQLLVYHPDTYREDTAEWSKPYAHSRTQAIIEAFNKVKTPRLKLEYDNTHYKN